jgi:RNA polymerase sigma-70 factor, ECF subfamily
VAVATYLPMMQDSADAVPRSRSVPIESRLSQDPNIEVLIERAKGGSPDAFEQLARLYLRPAYSVALAIVRRPQDAEDVAQDALMLAFERLDSCREPGRFAAWLMTIVRNQARNWLDKRRLRDVLPEEPDESKVGVTASFEPSVERDKLLEALDALSAVEREVVLLHDLHGYTHDEIGELLNVSCVMSRQHLFVSRRKLRKTLQIGTGEGGHDG